MAVPIQSIQRAMSLLDFLAERRFTGGAVALREAATHLGLGVTTTHNLLKTLVHCGYARKVGDGLYDLGPAVEDLHRAAVSPRRLAERGQTILHGLAGTFHESVVLAVLFRGRRHTLARVSGDQQLAVTATDTDAGEIWGRVSGRVLAAFANDGEMAQVLEVNGLPTLWKGVSSTKTLDEALAAIRKHRWAEHLSDDGHIWSADVPVLDDDGYLLASLGMFMPAVRAGRQRVIEIRSALKNAAGELGKPKY